MYTFLYMLLHARAYICMYINIGLKLVATLLFVIRSLNCGRSACCSVVFYDIGANNGIKSIGYGIQIV